MWAMKRNVGIGEAGGFVLASFLIGVVIHSCVPYRVIGMEWFSALAAIGVLLIFFRPTRVNGWLVGMCVLALAFGLWRFEVGQRTMPRGLAPFTPDGLAFVTSKEFHTSNQNDPRYWLGRFRRTLNERADTLFAKDESALLTGILYGERALPKPLKASFRDAGLLHLIAVSGSNVTIIVVLIMPALLLLGLTRKRAFILLTGCLILFVLFVNPSASVVRAALMGWLLEFAPLVGRIPRPSRLLLIAATVFTLWKPWSLIYDASFALSFFAMFGVLTWATWFQERFEKQIRSDSIREMISMTLGATIMTMPYSAWAFGQVTLYGLPANLLALPLVPWIMGTGLLALIFPAIHAFTLAAQGFLQMLLAVPRIVLWLPYGSWHGLTLSFWTMAMIYVCIIALWIFVERKYRVIPRSDAFFAVRVQKEVLVSDEIDDE